MRIREGMWLRSSEIVQLERAAVNITPKVMTKVFCSLFVTAKVEQIPKIWTKTGLFLPNGSRNVFRI
jgi:hypothetical protein